MKVAAGHVQSSQGNPWPSVLNDSLHDPNNVPSPKINSRCVFKLIPMKRVVKALTQLQKKGIATLDGHTGMCCRLGSHL